MLQKKESKPAPRELAISRLLNAPRDLVWEVWTNPDHIQHWWGLTGFKNTIRTMDVKPEGIWDFVMHRPDGTDFKNKHIYKEVVRPERLVLDHITAPRFRMTVTFGAQGTKRWSASILFLNRPNNSPEVIRVFKADEGMKQNIDRLEAYVECADKNSSTTKNNQHVKGKYLYLNFPDNTEEAFKFYRSVLGGEFGGRGIQRFGDIPATEGRPPLSEKDKKLILHIELSRSWAGIVLMKMMTRINGIKSKLWQ